MKLFKKTAFWIVTLVALAGAFSLIDERSKVAKEIEAANLMLLPFGVDDVDEFWTKSVDRGIQLKAVKKKDGWWLVHPLKTKGDQKAILKLLKNIVKSQKDSILFEKPSPEKLKELGLDNPKLEFGLKVGEKETTIYLGDKGPTLNIAYAMIKGDTRVIRVHADVRTETDSNIYRLRNKTVLSLDPIKMRRLEIMRKESDTVVITHDQGKWGMVEPVEEIAFQPKVLETLVALRNAEVKEFLDKDISDLAPYGLDSPAISVSVLDQGQDNPVVLYIGSRDRKKRGYYAKNEGSPKVYLIEEDLVSALRSEYNNWLDAN